MSNYLQIKKSITTDTPASLLFGELAISNLSKTKVFIGKSDGTPQLIFDSSVENENFHYENNKQKYVAINGSDLIKNNGQVNEPFNTIEKGLNSIQTGGLVKLEAGNYKENINLTDTHSVKSIVGEYISDGIINLTEIEAEINITGKRITLSNLELVKNNINDLIKIQTNLNQMNINLNNISVSSSTLTNSNAILVEGGVNTSGYINISGCDLNNRKVYLKNSNSLLPKICYITRSRNFVIEAESEWLVYADDNSTFNEISNNKNIYRSWMITKTVNSIPSEITGIFIALEQIIVNPQITIEKGSVFVKQGNNYSILSQFYNARPSYWSINENKTFIKDNDTFKEAVSFPIILSTF